MTDQNDMRGVAVLMTGNDIVRNLFDIGPAPERDIGIALRLELRSQLVHAAREYAEQTADQIDLRLLDLKRGRAIVRRPLLRQPGMQRDRR